ncbi:hypothetical protein QBC46DRAFT_12744 [Diplogelasinospora grovesii]|uniref:J domain-containing protein n=1 Tax=Diplogelasinospora grovesii TaxID=303347 RepID=A0AAN6S2B5_9PEZI|nr:hypothetical protein QBC46DRAFT_12744 [Diplogelasinospora grovesii]
MEFEQQQPRSPKRRRILESFNPEKKDYYDGDGDFRGGRTATPVPPSTEKEEPENDHHHDGPPPVKQQQPDDAEREWRREQEKLYTKIRFKSTKKRRSRPRSRSRSRSRHKSSRGDDEGREHRHRHRHHRHHHHRHRRHEDDDRVKETEADREDPFKQPELDPEAAFRESLFDAMADDEGAAYWEGVYGQPIHTYANERRPGGQLEQMSDEDYAAYVRQKMWEKTHAGLVEERERRQKERKLREERERREDEENWRIRKEMERSLRRGEERRKKRHWRDRWEEYVRGWKEWDGNDPSKIPWPQPVTKSREGEGEREVVDEEVREFFTHGLDLEGLGEQEFVSRLKEERVRWHPDKMQQRLGGQVDKEVMKDVTAVFRVVDTLWNDMRKADGR